MPNCQELTLTHTAINLHYSTISQYQWQIRIHEPNCHTHSLCMVPLVILVLSWDILTLLSCFSLLLYYTLYTWLLNDIISLINMNIVALIYSCIIRTSPSIIDIINNISDEHWWVHLPHPQPTHSPAFLLPFDFDTKDHSKSAIDPSSFGSGTIILVVFQLASASNCYLLCLYNE